MPWWQLLLAVSYPSGDSLGYSLQHLFMMPTIVPFSQGFWATAQDVLQRSTPLVQGTSRGLCQAPAEQAGWAREGVVDWLDQESNPVWFSLPKICPDDLLVQCLTHHVQAPCCWMTTALQERPSSAPAQISSWTSWCLSFPLVLMKSGLRRFQILFALMTPLPPARYYTATVLPAWLLHLLLTFYRFVCQCLLRRHWSCGSTSTAALLWHNYELFGQTAERNLHLFLAVIEHYAADVSRHPQPPM